MRITEDNEFLALDSERIRKIEKRLKSDPKSEDPQRRQEGLMRNDQELLQLLKSDDEELKENGLTAEMIADHLDSVASLVHDFSDVFNDPENVHSVETTVRYNGVDFTVVSEIARQIFMCPFRLGKRGNDCHGSDYHDCGSKVSFMFDITITRPDTGFNVTFDPLYTHMIRHHHFFLGDVSGRVSPKQFKEEFCFPWGQVEKKISPMWVKRNEQIKTEEECQQIKKYAKKIDHDAVSDDYPSGPLAPQIWMQDHADYLREFDDIQREKIAQETNEIVKQSLTELAKKQREFLHQFPQELALFVFVGDRSREYISLTRGATLYIPRSRTTENFLVYKRHWIEKYRILTPEEPSQSL